MGPIGPHPTRSRADRVISTFLFDPDLEPFPHNLYQGEVVGPPESLFGMTQASIGRRVKEQWSDT